MNHLVATYGYWAVALFVAAESIGVPVPGETILIVAAIYAGHTHRLSVVALFAVATVAAIAGDNIGFWIGDKGGYRLLRRYGHYVHLDESKLKVGRYLFERHGGKLVFFGRFVSILRTYVAFLAGTNRMQWRKFLIYNTAGGIVWAGAWTFAAYTAGNSLRTASATINWILGGAAIAAIVASVFVLRRQGAKLVSRAEAAHPGSWREADGDHDPVAEPGRDQS
jgi:membrane protein DedA with SNARE-associated domain